MAESGGGIVAITGAPGAGKTTLARLLADASPHPRSVHLHADDAFAWLRKGAIEPWLPASHAQNAAVIEAVAAAAASLAASGYEVLLDGVIGPWFLDPFRAAAAARGVALDYVVLRPSAAASLERALGRTGRPLTDPEAVVRHMHAQFADLGPLETHAVDTTALSAEEAAAQVRDGLKAGRFRVG